MRKAVVSNPVREKAIRDAASKLSLFYGDGYPPTSVAVSKVREVLEEFCALVNALDRAGREQDNFEKRICISALERIGVDYEWMKRKDMIATASHALCDIGVWQKVSRSTGIPADPKPEGTITE